MPWLQNFYQTQVKNLVFSVTESSCWDLIDLTLACEDSLIRHTTPPWLTSCYQFWQPCCRHWNKTKAMLLMADEKQQFCWRRNKTKALMLIMDGTKQKPWCQKFRSSKKDFFWIQVLSLPCLVRPSNTQSVLMLDFAQNGFVKVVRWISLRCCRFFKIDRWISSSCYIDLSNLMHGFFFVVMDEFLQVVTWICQYW